MDDKELDAAVRAAYAARDGEALFALSKAHKALTACTHDHPWLHRIDDVDKVPRRSSVRILRCTKCNGRLYVRRQRGGSSVPAGLSIDMTLAEQQAYVAGALAKARKR